MRIGNCLPLCNYSSSVLILPSFDDRSDISEGGSRPRFSDAYSSMQSLSIRLFVSAGTYHDHVVLGGSLAGDLGEGIGLEAGVEDGIGDLIRKLVGVALVDGLGGEKEVALFADHDCKVCLV